MGNRPFDRRTCLKGIASAASVNISASPFIQLSSANIAQPQSRNSFQLNYIVSSCMYGHMDLTTVLREVRGSGAFAIDIWPKVHADHREQIDRLGEARFTRLLAEEALQFGCLTQYKLGPFALQDEIAFAKRCGCSLIVTSAVGPTKLTGPDLKLAVKTFVEKMRPHLEIAARHGLTIAIENHANNLIDSPDSLRFLKEICDQREIHNLAIAFAPAHLPQDANLLGNLLRELLPRVRMFYAWQRGDGFMSALPKPQELLQLPGRGPLDFRPMIEALREGLYAGWTSIFMHPYPRGIAILESTKEVTDELNVAKDYLDKCCLQVS